MVRPYLSKAERRALGFFVEYPGGIIRYTCQWRCGREEPCNKRRFRLLTNHESNSQRARLIGHPFAECPGER